MATFNWPGFGIKSIAWNLNQPSQSNASGWTGKRTVIADPWHGKWSARVEFAPVVGEANMLLLRSFLAKMKGGISTFHLPAAEAPQNANTGVTVTTTVAAGVTSMTLSGVTTALLEGQLVTVNGQLLQLTANQSGSTITFLPALRQAATAATAVETAKPYALVYLTNSSQGWSVDPGQVYSVSIDVEEAVAETDGADPSLDVWTGGIGSGGGGGGVTFTFPQLPSFTSRSLLAAVSSPTNKQVAYLTEVGREGEFVFSTANLSALVTADPLQGLYVAPASATSGASGAWVRMFRGAPHVDWWGTKGDYDGNTGLGTNNGSIFTAVMTTLQALALAQPELGAVWHLGRSLSLRDGGRYYTTSPFNIVTSLEEIDFTGAEIVIPADSYGIIINADTTNGEAARTSGPFPFFCKLINPKVRGHNGTDLAKHGIWMRRTAYLVNPQVVHVSGDMIRIGDNGAFTDGNQNGWRIDNPYGEFCGGNGIKAKGTNANAGTCINYNIGHCGRFAIDDASALGNKWHGQSQNCGIVLAGVNTIPAFTYSGGHIWAIIVGQEASAGTVTPSSARPDVWWDLGVTAGGDPAVPAYSAGMTMMAGGDHCTVNCAGTVQLDVAYQEGGYNASQLSDATSMRDPNGATRALNGIVEYPDATRHALVNTKAYLAANTDASGTSYSRIGGFGASNVFGQYVDTAGHNWNWQATGGFLGLFDGQTGEYPIAITVPGDGVNFGRSTEQNGVLMSRRQALGWSNLGRIVDMDSAAPTTGYHAAGELVFNNAAAAGGKVGWVCVTAGTPGTWKPFGAIDA